MKVYYYTPTYENKRTLDKVPDAVMKKYAVPDETKAEWFTPEIFTIAQQLTNQRNQAVAAREFFDKKFQTKEEE